jgi:hypothetical protein
MRLGFITILLRANNSRKIDRSGEPTPKKAKIVATTSKVMATIFKNKPWYNFYKRKKGLEEF